MRLTALKIFCTTAGLFWLPVLAHGAPQWSTSSISLLRGDNFVVESDVQTVVTLEHASGWGFGDLFVFADITDYHDSSAENGFYGEFSPRFSLGKLSGKDFSSGVVKDLLVATTCEFGRGDVESFMVGPAMDFVLPGFDYFQVNVYQRFTEGSRPGETIQITPVWGMSWPLAGSELLFEGFADWNVTADKTYKKNIHINPRLRYDVGRLFGSPNRRFLAGVEYSYWRNKYGIEDSAAFTTDQSALSLMVTGQF